MKLPDFKVDASSFNVSVSWRDAERKYHFWLRNDGTPTDDILHSNPIEKANLPYGKSGHRSLDATSKKWAPLIAGIMEKIKADDLIAKAKASHAAAEKDKQERREHAFMLLRLKQLTAALALLPPEIRTAIEMLPPQIRSDFVAKIEAADWEQRDERQLAAEGKVAA